MDCSPPGSSVHGILQARILEWVAISFSRGSSPSRDRTQFSHIAGGFTLWATRDAPYGECHYVKISTKKKQTWLGFLKCNKAVITKGWDFDFFFYAFMPLLPLRKISTFITLSRMFLKVANMASPLTCLCSHGIGLHSLNYTVENLSWTSSLFHSRDSLLWQWENTCRQNNVQDTLSFDCVLSQCCIHLSKTELNVWLLLWSHSCDFLLNREKLANFVDQL